MNIQIRTILLGLLSIGFAQSHAQTFALQVKDDRITYLNDELGNRILDFSTCGYQASEQDIPYVREEIVQKYHFTKVNIITSGGAERYLSVGRALQLIADGRLKVPNEHGYVFIHDGARPFLTEKILEDTYAAAVQYQAWRRYRARIR